MIEVTYKAENGRTVKQHLRPEDKLLVMRSEGEACVEKPSAPGWGWRKVTNVFHGETMEWLHVVVPGEEIKCTQEHPFSVKGKGWVAACDLQSGDELITSSGKECVVIETWLEKLDKPEKTYNIEVEGAHNYCVGNSGILVHNICVVQDGNFRADVKKGGDPNHLHTGHAHIYDGSRNIASVKADGTLMAGQLKGKAADFVINHLDKIADGIKKYYWMGRK